MSEGDRKDWRSTENAGVHGNNVDLQFVEKAAEEINDLGKNS